MPGATRFTTEQARWFTANFDIITHYPNDASGFSATLFRNRSTGEYTLSFRSTEYQLSKKGGDYERDGASGADGDISTHGFALAQLSSMETFYEHLKRGQTWNGTAMRWDDDPALRPFAEGTPSLNLTGYSLGAQLATSFTLMHEADVRQTWLYNAAGVGGITSASFENAIPTGDDIEGLIDAYRSLMSFDGGNQDDIAYWQRYITGSVLLDDYVAAANQARGLHFDNVYDNPLHDVVMKLLAPAMYPVGAGDLADPDDAMGDRRVRDAAANFTLTDLNSVTSSLFTVPSAGAWAKIRQFHGHGEFLDLEVVASSGWHVAPMGVFIEDLPLSRGMGIVELVIPQVRELVGEFGETHSITPLIDAMTVLDMLQGIDPQFGPGEFAWLGRAAANSVRAVEDGTLAALLKFNIRMLGGPIDALSDGVIGRLLDSRIHDADALENIVNAIHRILVGSDPGLAPDTAPDRVAEGYGNLAERNALHDAIAVANQQVAVIRAAGVAPGIRTLKDVTAAAIVERALQPTVEARAWRYALRELNPFVVTGIDYAQHGADGSLDLLDAGAGGGLSEQWIRDRAEFLAWKVRYDTGDGGELGLLEVARGNIPYGEQRTTDWVEGDWRYLDLAARDQDGNPIAIEIDGNGLQWGASRITFGSDAGETLEGTDGDDRLYGAAGDDQLDGRSGDDLLDGGAGADVFASLSGRDVAVDAAGDDVYEVVGDARVEIRDADGLGVIRWNGMALPVGVLDTTERWNDGLPRDGAIFRSVDGRFSYVFDGKDLVIMDRRHPGSSVTVRDVRMPRAGEAMGITLQQPVVGDPPSMHVGSGGDDSVRISSVPSHAGDVSTVTAAQVRLLDGNDMATLDPVQTRAAEILLGPGRDRLVIEQQGMAAGPYDLSAVTVRAGDGDDILQPLHGLSAIDDSGAVAGPGARYFGEQGNDFFEGTGMEEFVDGGSGHDMAFGRRGDDLLHGGDGNDWVDGGAGSDLVGGGAGNDWMFGADGADVMLGGAGDDSLYGDSRSNIMTLVNGTMGWNGSKVLVFDLHSMLGFRPIDYNIVDVAAAAGGNDDLRGGDGNDRLFGGVGEDRLFGEAGGDRLHGEAGADLLDGGDGDDVLYGDKDPKQFADDMQTVWFSARQTDIDSGAVLGTTQIYMRRHIDAVDVAGDDVLLGGAGNDLLVGGGGKDRLDGGTGIDTLRGGGGDDQLDGGEGNDQLFGGADDDRLVGGLGNDTLIDESGDEAYFFAAGWGDDTIDDHDGNGTLYLDAAAAAVTEVRVGKDLRFELGSDSVMVRNWFAGGALGSVRYRDLTRTRRELDERLASTIGTAGDDLLTGVANADDIIIAGGGNDVVNGLGGNDRIDGGTGDDQLAGGDGDDTLISGGGNDRLAGGAGRDRYVLSPGKVVITDADAELAHSTVVLPVGVDVSTVSVRRLGNDLRIQYGPDNVSISDYYRAASNWSIETVDGRPFDPANASVTTIPDAEWVQSFWDAGYGRHVARLSSAVAYDESRRGWSASRHGTVGYVVRDAGIRTSTSTGSSGGGYIIVLIDEDGNAVTDREGQIYYFWPESFGTPTVAPRSGFSYPSMWVVDSQLVDRTQRGSAGADSLWSRSETQFLPRERIKAWATIGDLAFRSSANGLTYFDLPVVKLERDIPASRIGITSLAGGGNGYVADIDLYHTRRGVNVIHGGDGDDAINDLASDEGADWLEYPDGWYYDAERASWTPVFPLVDGDPGASDDPVLADGGAGNDTIYGFARDDVLRGGGGDDLMNGLGGDDVIAGEQGSDRLIGDSGRHTFLVGGNDTGVDVIVDNGWFEPNPFDPYEDARNHAAAFGDVLQFNLTFAAVTIHRIGFGSDREALLFTWMVDGRRQGAVSVFSADSGEHGFGIETYRFIDGEYSREQLLALAIIGGDPGVAIPMGLHDLDSAGVLTGTSVADDIDHRRWPAPYDPRTREGLRVAAGDGNDVIVTGARDDLIDGGRGDDLMTGGAGDDVYVVDSIRDRVVEAAGAGHDVVRAGVSFSLADAAAVEDLTLTGSMAIDGAGNATGNRLTGNVAGNRLDGGAGDDVVDGQAGDDTLRGGDGSDVYLFNLGDGLDTIIDAAEVNGGNRLSFGTGIDAATIRFERSGPDLVIRYGDRGDAVRVTGYFDAADVTRLIAAIALDDGTTVLPPAINAPPRAGAPIATLRASEDQALAWVLPASAFVDDDDPALAYHATRADGSPLPPWLRIERETGALSGTPGNADVGTIDVILTATDRAGQSAAQAFAIEVVNVNDAPIAVGTMPAAMVDEDAPATITIPRSLFVEIDAGDSLSLMVTGADGTALPPWLRFDPLSLRLAGVPGNAEVGAYDLMVIATDTSGASARVPLTLIVANVNDAPELAMSLVDQPVRAGEPLLYQVPAAAFRDIDLGDRLTLSASLASGAALPGWLAFDPSSGRLSGIVPRDAAGIIDVRIAATDTAGATVSDDLRITIEPSGRVLVGTGGADLLIGGAGDDVLDGGAGADTLRGLGGNDTFQFSRDATWGSFSVANAGSPGVVGSGEASVSIAGRGRTLDTYEGGDGDDLMRGTAAADVVILDTGSVLPMIAGIEAFAMGDGDDVVDLTSSRFAYAGVSIDGGDGSDVLWSSAGNDRLTGGAGNDRLSGGSGDDWLDGGSGADVLRGGAGNDTYVVDSALDTVHENANQGEDLVISSVSRTLVSNFEHLLLSGGAATNGTGNALGNWLRGNVAANTLDGQGGNDTLWGDAGNDVLLGDAGTDLLQGGDGDDVLTDASGNGLLDGGGGADRLTGGGGRELHIGGRGNDVITTGTGVDVIAFNRGDGVDIVNASSGSDNTLSLGGGIGYDDLVLRRSGLDLILGVGRDEQITFRNWYQSGTNNRSVVNLQMVAEAMRDFDASSTDPLRSRKVTQFDFLGLVERFDAARGSNPTLANWPANTELAGELIAASDTSALGGDLAYRYGRHGMLAGMGASVAQGIIGASGFGSAMQALQPTVTLPVGTATLA